MKPKVAFCVIVEGDSKLPSLKRLLDSVASYVDEICITANGGENSQSTAETEEYCKEQGFNFSFKAWSDDFGLQRNFNFSQVSDDIDYILWADSDDVIVNAHLLPGIVQKAYEQNFSAVLFSYWYGCRFEGEPSEETLADVEVTQSRERLLKRDAYIWKGRIHETPVPLPGVEEKYNVVSYSKQQPIAWLHLGADRNISAESLLKRMDRNQRLLELQLADERKAGDADPRTILYLMKIYAESNEENTLKLCETLGEEYLTKSGWDRERGICLSLMATAVGKLGDDRQAIHYNHQAIQEYPKDPLFYLKLSSSYYNVGNYNAMKHWLDVAMAMEVKETDNIVNIYEINLTSAELILKYYLTAQKDIERAYKAAETMYKLNPTENNLQNKERLQDKLELNRAAEHTHKLINYLESIGEVDAITKLIETLPAGIKNLPFAHKLYSKFAKPRIWKDNEICYYANFGNNHFEKWSPKSLEKGIGGSETAVIQLAKEWTKLGYKVTVYGDPGVEEGEHDGVFYKPWYAFNPKDSFNIFIQWRHSGWAGKVSAKKFLVDLHDVYHADNFKGKLQSIDQIMVKSKYHRQLANIILDAKFTVISNGI